MGVAKYVPVFDISVNRIAPLVCVDGPKFSDGVGLNAGAQFSARRLLLLNLHPLGRKYVSDLPINFIRNGWRFARIVSVEKQFQVAFS